MKNILSHIHRHSKRSLAHVKKHKHKYLFGIFGGFALLKMVVVFAGFLGIMNSFSTWADDPPEPCPDRVFCEDSYANNYGACTDTCTYDNGVCPYGIAACDDPDANNYGDCENTDLPQSECEVLVNLYNQTAGTGRYNSDARLQSNEICNIAQENMLLQGEGGFTLMDMGGETSGRYGIVCEDIADEGLHVTEINLPDNNLRGVVDLSGLSYLKRINLGRMEVLELAGGGMTLQSRISDLGQPSSMKNHITQIDVSGLYNIEYINLDYNLLEEIDLSGLENIQEISISNNRLENLDLSDQYQLYYINIPNNRIGVLRLPFNAILTREMEGQLIERNLSYINAKNNLIYWFGGPLKFRNNVSHIDVSYNLLPDIDVEGLSNLSYLDISHNNITEIDLMGLSSLGVGFANLSNNLLTWIENFGNIGGGSVMFNHIWNDIDGMYQFFDQNGISYLPQYITGDLTSSLTMYSPWTVYSGTQLILRGEVHSPKLYDSLIYISTPVGLPLDDISPQIFSAPQTMYGVYGDVCYQDFLDGTGIYVEYIDIMIDNILAQISEYDEYNNLFSIAIPSGTRDPIQIQLHDNIDYISSSYGISKWLWILAGVLKEMGSLDEGSFVEHQLKQSTSPYHIIDKLCNDITSETSLNMCWIWLTPEGAGLENLPGCGADIYIGSYPINTITTGEIFITTRLPYEQDEIDISLITIPKKGIPFELYDNYLENNVSSVSIEQHRGSGVSCINTQGDISLQHGDTSIVYIFDAGSCMPYNVTCIEGSIADAATNIVWDVGDYYSTQSQCVNSVIPPIAQDIMITGIGYVGFGLTGAYIYSGIATEGNSIYQWYKNNASISGANTISYTPNSNDIGSIISFGVTPVSNGGSIGEPTISSGVFIKDIPHINTLEIEGNNAIGATLTGTYTYSGDHAEGASLYQWYRNGQAITGQTGISYIILATDAGKNIQFKVTPVSQEDITGSAIMSEEFSINSFMPSVSDVSIQGYNAIGSVLTGTYTYSGDHAEGSSLYQRYRNAQVITGQTGISYLVLSTDAGKNLQFEVTPVSTYEIIGNTFFSSGITISTNVPPLAQNVAISGLPNIGQTLIGNYTYFDPDRKWDFVGGSGVSFTGASIISLAKDSSGSAYMLYTDEGIGGKLSLQKWDGSNRTYVGSSGFNSGYSQSPSLAIGSNNIPYVAFMDWGTGGKLSVMKRNGTGWSYVGIPGFSLGYAYTPIIAVHSNGTPYVAFRDYRNGGSINQTSVMRWNGSSWVAVGAAIANAGNFSFTIAPNGTPYVSYSDSSQSNKLTVKKFNGSSWILVGTAGFSSTAYTHTLVLDDNNIPYVATDGEELRKFNGSIWQKQGPNITDTESINVPSLIIKNNIPYVAYSYTKEYGDVTETFQANVKMLSGAEWKTLGLPGFLSGDIYTKSLIIDQQGSLHLAYRNNKNRHKAAVMKFNDVDHEGNSVYQWYRNNVAITGATTQQYTILSGDAGDSIRFQVTPVATSGSLWGTTTQSTGILINSPPIMRNLYISGMLSVGQTLQAQYDYYDVDRDRNILGTRGFSSGEGYSPSMLIDQNNVPMIAYTDNGLSSKASVVYRDGSRREYIGDPGFTPGGASFISFVVDHNNVPYIAYKDISYGFRLSVMHLNHNNIWENVGLPGFSSGEIHYPSLVIDGENILYVAYRDYVYSNKLSVQKRNGVNWQHLTVPGISEGSVSETSTVADGNNIYVAYKDAAYGSKLSVLHWDGDEWEYLDGPGVSVASISYPSLAVNNSGVIYVAYTDSNASSKMTVMEWNGSDWNTIGSAGFSSGTAQNASLKIDQNNNLYVAYTDSANSSKVTVMMFSGDTRQTVVSPGFSVGSGYTPSLAIDQNNVLYLAYRDGGISSKLSTMVDRNIPGVHEYQRYKNNVVISGSDSSTYTVGIDDIGQEISFSSIPKAMFGSSPGMIQQSTGATISNIRISDVTISGTVQAGKTIEIMYTYQHIENASEGSSLYQWYRNGESISGADQKTYTLSIADLGSIIGCKITPISEDLVMGYPYTYDGVSIPTSTVIDNVYIEGVPRVGRLLIGQYSYLDVDDRRTHLGVTGFSESNINNLGLMMTTNDVPYLVYNDVTNGNKITIKSRENNHWNLIETKDFTSGTMTQGKATLGNDNSIYFGYRDHLSGNKLTVMKFDGTDRVLVGSRGFSSGGGFVSSLSVDDDDNIYVLYVDEANSRKMSMMKWNGSVWALIGSGGFSSGEIFNPSFVLDANGIPYVAYTDAANSNKLTVKKWNGSGWATVGPVGASIGAAYNVSIAIDSQNTPYVSYMDAAKDNKMTIILWTGNTREYLGISGFSIGSAQLGTLRIGQDDSIYIAYQDRRYGGRATVMKRENAQRNVLEMAGFTKTNASYLGFVLSSNDTPYIAYSENRGGQGRAMKFYSIDDEPRANYQWYRNGQAITGATGRNYVLTSEDAGKTITFEVIPIIEDEIAGIAFASQGMSIYNLPTALEISVTGAFVKGNILTGNYIYHNTAEGTSLYQRYRGEQEIPDATGRNYLLRSEDIGTYIRFGVTPVSSENEIGSEYRSMDYRIYDLPAKIDLSSPISGSIISTGDISFVRDGNPTSILLSGYMFQLSGETLFTPTSGIEVQNLADGQYERKVYVLDQFGYTGEWSDVYNFLVDTTPPTQTQQTSPSSGTVLAYSGVSLLWEKSTDMGAGISGYLVQISTGSNFTHVLWYSSYQVDTGVSITVRSDGTYYWRVQAMDNAGHTGAWSQAWSFTRSSVPLPSEVVTLPSAPGGGGGGGGGAKLLPDICPSNRDCSNSYYDTICGPCSLKEYKELKIEHPDQPSLLQSKELLQQEIAQVKATTDKSYSDELVQAYVFAKDMGITNMPTIDKARLEEPLIRSHMAKMISNFAIKILQTPIDTGSKCNFADMDSQSQEMQTYAKLVCQLGLMGLESDGKTPMKNFNPSGIVTRAEFGTVLSRALYGDNHNIQPGETIEWYSKHLNILKTHNIIKYIENPFMEELRGRVMLMMMRVFTTK